MKRLTVFVMVAAGLTTFSLGQYGSRSSPRRVYQLTEPKLTGPVSLEQVLVKRRSVRQFASLPLSLAQIGQLAWAGQGVTDRERGFRTAPSAGAIYPIELYFATKDGLFVYNPGDHSLEQTSDQDLRGRLAAAVSDPEIVVEAACDIILAGSIRKLAVKYGKQARRYLLLEAGHIAQNIQLQAASLELGSVSIAGFDIREVSKVARLPKSLEPIYMVCVGYPAEEAPVEGEQVRQMRAAMIIAGGNFRDEELFETRLVLQDAGVETVVASSRIGPIKGMLGGTAEAMILVGELRVDDFDAIVFVGGPGAAEYFDNPIALNIAREAVAKGKVLAAICVAPAVLANAGVLNGVRATSFLSERERLQVAGAVFTGTPVERDGLIITASNPGAASLFGRAIADALSGR